MDRNLAPWQKRDGPMYLSEKQLLNRLVERGVSTPEDLAEDRFRENVIRLQCRLLKQNDVDFPDEEWPGDHIERAVLHSKIIRGLHSDVKYNSLWLKDELYVSWHRYFRNFLLDCENRMSMKPTLKQLRSVINHGRENGF